MITYPISIAETGDGETYSRTSSYTENVNEADYDGGNPYETLQIDYTHNATNWEKGKSGEATSEYTFSPNGAKTEKVSEKKYESLTYYQMEFENNVVGTFEETWAFTRITNTDGLVSWTTFYAAISQGAGGDTIGGDNAYYLETVGEDVTGVEEWGLVATNKTTTEASQVERLILVTSPAETFLPCGTTTVLTDGTNYRTVATTTQTQTQTTTVVQRSEMVQTTAIKVEEDLVPRRTWREFPNTDATGFDDAPRKFATVYIPEKKDAVWEITDFGTPWAARHISEIAVLRSNEFTLTPSIFASEIAVIGADLPDSEVNYDTITEYYTTIVADGEVTLRTIWTHGISKAFPLESYEAQENKLRLTQIESEYITALNNTSPVSSSISTWGNPIYKNSVSYSAEGSQVVGAYDWTYTTSGEAGWTTTGSTQYQGARHGAYGTDPEFQLGGSMDYGSGETISIERTYQKGWAEFNPANVYHQETEFLAGWQRFGEGEQPKSKIDLDGVSFWPIFDGMGANIKHAVAVAFPNTTIWTSGITTMFGKMLGNAATITSQDTSSTTSQSYSFQGEGIAITSQRNPQAGNFFYTLADIPNFKIVGNNPVTQTNKAIGQPGVYGVISFANSSTSGAVVTQLQNSPFTETIITAPKVYFPAEKKWWPVYGGQLAVITNLGPTPDGRLPR